MSFGMPLLGAQSGGATTCSPRSFYSRCARRFGISGGAKSRCTRVVIRAFSVGLAVATIRPVIGMFFATSRFSGLTPSEFFGIAFWIGLFCISSPQKLGFTRRSAPAENGWRSNNLRISSHLQAHNLIIAL